MNEIVRTYKSHRIRIVEDNGEVYFVGKDVCVLLRYSNNANAIRHHCKDKAKYFRVKTNGGKQTMRVLRISDVIRLICGSHLQEAVRFEKWVFEEVLPCIQKTGMYSASNSVINSELVSNLIRQNQMLLERNVFLEQFRPADEADMVSFPSDGSCDSMRPGSSSNVLLGKEIVIRTKATTGAESSHPMVTC